MQLYVCSVYVLCQGKEDSLLLKVSVLVRVHAHTTMTGARATSLLMGTLHVCDQPLQPPNKVGIWRLFQEAQQMGD